MRGEEVRGGERGGQREERGGEGEKGERGERGGEGEKRSRREGDRKSMGHTKNTVVATIL